MITTKQQRNRLYGCHNGVGFLAYKRKDNTIVETKFYIKDGIPCYLGNSKPVEFMFYEEEEK